MKSFFLTIFFVYLISELFASAFDVNCGIKGPENIEYIVGGDETGVHEFPWNVVGIFGQGGCGGSIIDRQWVVTAAHCINYKRVIVPPSQIRLLFASHNFNYHDRSVHDQRTFSVPVIKVFVNPNYNEQPPTSDIALLKLARPLPLEDPSKYVSAICLPEAETNIDELAGQTAIATGYGSIQHIQGVTSSVLLKTNLTIVSQEVCKKENPSVTSDVICAGADGHDVCTGDSGSELTTFNTKTNRWQLTGISSYVITNCTGQFSRPSAFTRVSHMLPWIHQIMARN